MDFPSLPVEGLGDPGHLLPDLLCVRHLRAVKHRYHYTFIMCAVAEDQDLKPDPKAAAPAPSVDDDDSFIQRLRRVLPPILDELLDLDDKDEKPPPKSAPSTLREKEESVRDQVAKAVRELEEESRQKRQPEPAPATPPPPQAEVKPWRHRFWGDS